MDGIVQPGEECDDGNANSGDSCLAEGALWAQCGDGVVYSELTDAANPNALEECDDGNSIDDDDCTNACQLSYCGDGIVQPGEECDDANADNTDGCTVACLVGS